jgi:Cu(I)/Ag(I) efflux system membrane fusion protein
MDDGPVYADEAEAASQGIVKVSPGRVQEIGVKSEPVGRRDLVRPIRAVGTVQFDERRTFVFSTRFEGWIEKLLVNATGETVRRGQPLMHVYSPDLVLAQQEYALLSKSLRAAGSLGGEGAATCRLLEGAEQRLRYLDFPAPEMQRLKREAEPRTIVTIPSPVAGTVIEKPALQGMRFTAGEPLYKIVDMSQVWLLAEVFEQDLANVRVGQEATITLRAYPGRTFKGRVAFIYPTVGQATRTAKVRIEIPNPGGELKADMYATLEIASPLGPRNVLAVPASAVLDNGVRQVVLIDRGEGRFEPRTVKLGARADSYVEVIEGVRDGDPVVVSANFLIDAESNLKTALADFAEGGHQHQ